MRRSLCEVPYYNFFELNTKGKKKKEKERMKQKKDKGGGFQRAYPGVRLPENVTQKVYRIRIIVTAREMRESIIHT